MEAVRKCFIELRGVESVLTISASRGLCNAAVKGKVICAETQAHSHCSANNASLRARIGYRSLHYNGRVARLGCDEDDKSTQ
jgi:hypothetical protein